MTSKMHRSLKAGRITMKLDDHLGIETNLGLKRHPLVKKKERAIWLSEVAIHNFRAWKLAPLVPGSGTVSIQGRAQRHRCTHVGGAVDTTGGAVEGRE